MASKAELVEILTQQGVDTTPLKLLFTRDQEHMYSLSTEGLQAVTLWQTLRGMVDKTGHWPVILGDSNSAESHVEFMEYEQNHSTAEIIEAGLEIDAAEWLRSNFSISIESLRGEWPEDIQPESGFTIPFDHVQKAMPNGNITFVEEPIPSVYIALIPTKVSWHVPAFLRFGAWNDCPWPREHVSVMKRWNDLYGAEVVGISQDTVEMQVARPPMDRESAMKLGEEQFAYCNDIVYQGYETLSTLAANLLGATVWWFWWD